MGEGSSGIEGATQVEMVTVNPSDQSDVTAGVAAHLAWAFTLYVSSEDQECEADVELDHAEKLPSSQSNRYSTPCPCEQEELPVV